MKSSPGEWSVPQNSLGNKQFSKVFTETDSEEPIESRDDCKMHSTDLKREADARQQASTIRARVLGVTSRLTSPYINTTERVPASA